MNYNCRICFDESDIRNDFIVPCNCEGTGKYVHKDCLNQWLKMGSSGLNYQRCNSCLSNYIRKEDTDKIYKDKMEKEINNEITECIIFFVLLFLLIASIAIAFPIFAVFILVIIYWVIYTAAIICEVNIYLFIIILISLFIFQNYKKDKLKEKSCFLIFITFLATVFLFKDLYYEQRLKEMKSLYRLSKKSLMYDRELKIYVDGVL